MHAFTQKIVLALLVLSLNLVPFRGAFAGFVQPSDKGQSHEGVAHHAHASGAIAGNMTGDSCHSGQLSDDGCCSSDACSDSHCVSATYLVPPHLIDLSVTVSVVQAILVDQSLLQQTVSPPFRPPRL